MMAWVPEVSEALDQIRSRFFELSELGDQLDNEEKDRLFKRWESDIAQYSRALIGSSLDEWVSRAKEAILFWMDRLARISVKLVD